MGSVKTLNFANHNIILYLKLCVQKSQPDEQPHPIDIDTSESTMDHSSSGRIFLGPLST